MVSMRRFRSDLYYRLSVLPIELPPLRERIGDLEALCDHILEEIARRSGRPQRELTPTALAVLSAYGWPGNIRELSNILEQVSMNSNSPRLSAEEFTLVLPRVAASSPRGERPTLKLADIVADAERAPSARRSPRRKARRSSPPSCSASRGPRSTRSSRSWPPGGPERRH
jgi:transcriptional regulator with GAF, ATPase, and Fis domain